MTEPKDIYVTQAQVIAAQALLDGRGSPWATQETDEYWVAVQAIADAGQEQEQQPEQPGTDAIIQGWTPWFENTLTGATAQTCATKLAHEAQELTANPQDLVEAADVLVVLASWCVFTKRSFHDLALAADAKMRVNQSRTWQRQADGTYQHIEGT